jgi:hypothetical protein
LFGVCGFVTCRSLEKLKAVRQSYMVFLVFLLFITILGLSGPAGAWQMGASTTQSANASGISASRLVHGTLPGDGWYTAVSGFTDNGGWWHTIGQDNDGNLAFEAIDTHNHNWGYQLCSGRPKDVYHDGQIYYIAKLYEWINTFASTDPNPPCKVGSVLGDASGSAVQGSSIDMLESLDSNNADWSNLKVYVIFSPTLELDLAGTWYPADSATYYCCNGNAPTSIGQYLYCSGGGNAPMSDQISSNYAPPKSSGGLNCL